MFGLTLAVESKSKPEHSHNKQMVIRALKLYAEVHEVDVTGLVDAYVTPSLSAGSASVEPPVLSLSISVPKLKKSVSFDNVVKVKMITPKAESNNDEEDEDEDDGSQTGRAI